MILSLLASFAFATSDLPGEEIYVAPPQTEPRILSPVGKNPTKALKGQRSKQKALPQAISNLPVEYRQILNRELSQSELLQPPKGSTEIFRSLKVGDTVPVYIGHSVIAFPDEKAPVVAISNDPRYRGLKFIGESKLEQNTKRIFIHFTRLVVGSQIYQLKAEGLSADLQPGLMGNHHSREAEYFAGDFISSFVAGYFDGLVPRHTNAFGQIEQDQTIDTATKKGLASGALSSAERFREKLKKIPEFSELPGPFSMKILILEQAVSSR